ncbi:MAG: LLM class flavin-dependent oxidoreductase [Pseudorhodoplanes sp.]
MNENARKPGLLLAGRFAPAELVRIVRTAEDCDFGQIWFADERFYRDVYAQLTFIAASTTRIDLGTCVTDPYSRHPALTAVAIATLDEISGGRAILGVGAGLSGFAEMNVDRRKPVVAMREMIDLIRKLLKGGSVDYQGEIVSFREGHLHFQPMRAEIPVYIASNGPLGQKLAARVAQGAIMEACGSVQEAGAFVERIREAAIAAKRGPSDVRCVARLNFSVSADGKRARDALRARVARNLVGGYMSFATENPELALPPEAVEKVAGIPYSAGIGPYEALASFVTDKMVDAVALGGTAAEIVDHIVALRRCGIDNIIISPNPAEGETIESNIQVFARDIWPAVGAQLRTQAA